MDLLSLAVQEMRLQRAEYQLHPLGPRAVLAFSTGAAHLHFVEGGPVEVEHEGARLIAAEGDVLLFPAGAPHTFRTGGGAGLVSGQIVFEAADHPLLRVLPGVVHAASALVAKNPRFAGYVQSIAAEVRAPRDGTDALVARLTDVLFIETMRFFTPPPGVECPVGGFFGALNDLAIRKVLTAIHQAPGNPWTVSGLAALAGESRSSFAAHFANVMKEPPMAYLSRWRMFRGRSLLRQTELGLAQIAEQLGYGSAAAFSQAFMREHGKAPGAYRSEPR